MAETVIDGRCHCSQCEERTQETYEQGGACSNCGAGPFRIIYRAGDPVSDQDCPMCGNYGSVRRSGQCLVHEATL